MDDSRLANLLFLAGIASLAIPGCGGDGEPGVGPGGGAPGNPLASHNSLDGRDTADICAAYVSKLIECGGYDDDDDYGSGGYSGVSIAPGSTDSCDQYLALLENYGGPGCVVAVVDYYSCLSGLSCQALSSGESSCSQTFAVAEDACFFDSEEGDGGE